MTRSTFWQATLLACALVAPAAAQDDRARALQLFRDGKHIEALPLLKTLAAATPGDRAVATDLGFVLFEESAKYPDAADRKAHRAEARAMFVRAEQLGETDAVVLRMIKAIPEDGGADPVFSQNPGVDSAMRRGEVAYSAADLPTALAAYQEALRLDPQLYMAAVFIGDTYHRMNQVDSAVLWYDKAVVINPDRELAYRYKSDALLKARRFDEARDAAVGAIVADPFNRIDRQALAAWGRSANAPGGLPLIEIPPRDTTLHSRATAAYDSVHRDWRGAPGALSAAFVRQFPTDTVYRTSVFEEAAALRAAAASGDSTVSTANIKRLDAAGELEAFVFFAHANDGIAHDYRAYAAGHHDLLMHFWLDYVVGGKYMK